MTDKSLTSMEDKLITPVSVRAVFAPRVTPVDTGILDVQNQVTSLQVSGNAIKTSLGLLKESTAALKEGGTAPGQCTSVSAVESPYKTTSGQMLSLVAVDYTPPSDHYFESVEIWFTGYNGNPHPQLIADGSVSPVQFLAETTHEGVTVTVVSVSGTGVRSPFVNAPTCTVTLDGVTSPPPAPSIAQAQIALKDDSGWQFQFNILSGFEHDLVQGYWVYHSLSSATPNPPASRYLYIPQSSSNIGVQTVSEFTPDILYYWVSAVNVQGMESVLAHVPFTYLDPNDPAPPAPVPVETTKIYHPVTALNGWTIGSHQQYCESQDVLVGSGTFGTCKLTAIPYASPYYAYDGNQGTAALFSQTHSAHYGGMTLSFAAYTPPPAATVTGVQLAITSEVRPTSGVVHGEASIWYSTDNEATWTSVYVTGYDQPRYKRTDTITLSAALDLTKLVVMLNAHGHDDIETSVYEVSLAVTSTGMAGPQKITGTSAQLTSGNVQVNWSGLTPLSRADIASYQVYRSLHGGGYASSHLHATITPTGAATYNWTDVTGHDPSFDYWVVAEDTAGNFGTPSDTIILNLSAGITTGLSSLTSSSIIASIASIPPPQVNSDWNAVSGVAQILNKPVVSSALGVTIDGGTTTPLPGSKGYLRVPFACTITGWELLADQTGTASITVKKCTDAAFPTTVSIVASAPPQLTGQQKNNTSTLTGWTTSLSAGDILEFNLDSVLTCLRLTLSLQISKL